MSTSDPARHLLRAAGGAVRPLGVPTGLARLGLEERALPAGGRVSIAGPPAAEGFLYALAGSGQVTSGGEQEGITAGDFLGIAPGEVLVLENVHDQPLRILVGFSEGGPDAVSWRAPPE